jgi:DNA-binding transcriptional ArsR family regulator
MPLARADELIIEELADEVLIYDQRTDHAHCLSSMAGAVWRACDGASTIEQVSERLGIEQDTVLHAIDELERTGLLDSYEPVSGGVTRREVTVKIAKVGAASAALAPLIYSISAPTALAAGSQCLVCVQDCGDCHKINCCCCGPGNNNIPGAAKLCTATCGPADCNAGNINAHCNTMYAGAACNGPGLVGC